MADQNKNTASSLEEAERPPEPTAVLPSTYGIGSTSGRNTVRKMEWPELVGLMAEEAEKKEDMSEARVQVTQPNCFYTMDFNHRQVQLLVDSSGKVQKPRRIG